ncbi:hypothetical protein [Candidatus Entotheonella palauensis]|uniref:Uncharacterized protein n=1 Tax=Candidatus Entotheonella gemina TaxID=1429439 RepID=W4LLK3_9BACT|nr:hypothetical protein [Candidatus Entotheonella palauensis]ETW98605.1 MAG: hypothetical protein ETSY2_42570 [Candidatus Entotheonella gemina]
MVLHTERQIRSERLHDYFDLQLRFAQTVAEIASLPLADTVAHYTNFHRRFGLGRLQGAPRSAEWSRYIDQLNRLQTHEQRVAWTQSFFLQAPEESPPANQHHVGCFSCDPPNAEGFVRIHFVNRDNDGGTSSLKHTKIESRKRELRDMFTFIRSTYPSAKSVRGGSWLYHIQAYRRLFPPPYAESRVILKTGIRFDGTSSWGQFLDHREHIKPDLRDLFLRNLKRLDPDHLWRAFPLPALHTSAPIQVFYEFYDVEVPEITNASHPANP